MEIGIQYFSKAQRIMKNYAYMMLAGVLLLSGCELIFKDDVKIFAEELVKECNGKIDSVAIVKSAKGDNIYEAVAIAIIGEEKYDIDIELKTGLGDGIISSNDNPCLEHSIKSGVKEFFDLFK